MFIYNVGRVRLVFCFTCIMCAVFTQLVPREDLWSGGREQAAAGRGRTVSGSRVHPPSRRLRPVCQRFRRCCPLPGDLPGQAADHR